jgi:hypothetical protein
MGNPATLVARHATPVRRRVRARKARIVLVPVVVVSVRGRAAGGTHGGGGLARLLGAVVAVGAPRAEDRVPGRGVDRGEEGRRPVVRRVVVLHLGRIVLFVAVVAPGEERPQDADEDKEEDDACCDGDRDEDDDAGRKYVCRGKLAHQRVRSTKARLTTASEAERANRVNERRNGSRVARR